MGMKLQEQVRIFHEPDCPAMILSDETGKLTCAECGKTVGHVEPAILDQLISLVR
jgi:hypothetical protein